MVFGMLAGFVVLGTEWSAHGSPFWSSLWLAIAIGLPAGLAGACLSLIVDRREYKRKFLGRLGHIFSGDPDIVPPPPPTTTHRLVCGLLLSPRRVISGALYVTQTALVFQPHFYRTPFLKRLSRKYRPGVPDAVEIGPPRTVVLQAGRFRRHRRSRSTGHHPAEVIICRWEAAVAFFVVPQVEQTVARLQRCIDSLRAAV